MKGISQLPKGDQETIKKLLTETKAKHDQLLASAPEEVRRLGNIIRLGLKFGSTRGLERYLRRLGFTVGKGKIEAMRDVLIVHRGDLADLAPAARHRLRAVYLRNQPASFMTGDYAFALANLGSGPQCKDCRYFGDVPSDEGPDAKPCISLGARGPDLACFGFTRILQP